MMIIYAFTCISRKNTRLVNPIRLIWSQTFPLK
jgi:hypothetical protein